MAVLDWLQQLLGGGSEQEQGSAVAAQSVVLPYLQKVLSGEMAAGSLGGYDPNRRFAENALDPSGIETATNFAMGIGPGAIRAFHGSPHSFDRFDLSKIGTGEGNQTFGRGLYFSEAEPVAARYREMTAGLPKSSLIGPGGETLATGGPVQFQSAMRLPDVAPPGMDYIGASIKRLWAEGRPVDAPSVIKEAWGGLQLPPDALPEITTKVEAAIERAKPLLEQYRIETTRPGHMYEVDLNAKPEDFLQLDKPLSAQPQAALDIANQKWWGSPSPKLTGQDIYQELGLNPVDTAAALKEAGIPGTRYLDQFSRGSPSEGTHNYAVWDDRIIEIMRKFGILPPLAAGGLLAAPGPGEAGQP